MGYWKENDFLSNNVKVLFDNDTYLFQNRYPVNKILVFTKLITNLSFLFKFWANQIVSTCIYT